MRAQTTPCEVLNLVLGPIILNLLGLNLYIGGPDNAPIIVNITGDQDEGLLGGILCALAGGASLGDLGELTAFLQALNALLGLLG